MSVKLLTYSGITTKVRAMESRLLSIEDFERIANLETIPDFVQFLKGNPAYKEMFLNVDEHNLHRGQIEVLLMDSLYSDYYRIYKFADLKQRKILSFIFMRFETTLLKFCLQRIFNHQESSVDMTRSGFKDFFESHSRISIEQLLASRTLEEFTNSLKNTKYYNYFMMLNKEGNLTLFDYGMQLDIFYFREVWRLKDKYLKGSQLKALTNIYGNTIDLLNVLWIYRSKNYYNIENSRIFSYIIPINYKFKKDELYRLMDSHSLQEFGNILNESYYGKKYREQYGTLTQYSIEKSLMEIRSKLYSEGKQRYPYSITPVNSYIFFKEIEIDHLTTALECIRYELEPKEALDYIFQRAQ